MRYADPKMLPSYPTVGVRTDGSATAATLGWSKKPADIRFPQSSPSPASAASAAAAAFAVADAKANRSNIEPRHAPPAHASKMAAATMVASDKSRANATAGSLTAPPSASSIATRAASLRYHKTGVAADRLRRANSTATSQNPRDTTTAGGPRDRANPPGSATHSTSLTAAHEAAAAVSSRPRSNSTPQESQTASTARSSGSLAPVSSDALTAALSANKPSTIQARRPTPLDDTGAVPFTTMPRSMFTSNPPVASAVQERKEAEERHATAVAMAKTMYRQQQKIIDSAKRHQESAEGHDQSASSASPILNLQDAAYKIAQERLARLHEEHQKSRGLQEYYGTSATPSRKFSVKKRLRRRANSDGDVWSSSSEVGFKRLSLRPGRTAESAEDETRRQDRAALLAQAEKNVAAQLGSMDQAMYESTGRVPPSKLTQWEVKAYAVAQARHGVDLENEGKRDIGGGKYMSQEEIDEIAARRVQPMLEQINQQAQKEHERIAAQQEEVRKKKAAREAEKAKDREARQQRRQEKARHRQEEKEGKSRDGAAPQATSGDEEQPGTSQSGKSWRKKLIIPISGSSAPSAAANESTEAGPSQHNEDASSPPRPSTPNASDSKAAAADGQLASPERTETSPTVKVKHWLKSRFTRGRSWSVPIADEDTKRGFIGGAALRGRDPNDSNVSLSNQSASIIEVALAGTSREQQETPPTSVPVEQPVAKESPGLRGQPRVHDLEESGDDVFEEAAESLAPVSPLSMGTPPRAIRRLGDSKNSSPTRDSRFREIIE